MGVELRDVDALATPPGYSHVAVVGGTGAVITAGAVPLDRDGNLVGGATTSSNERVLENLLAALDRGGAAPEHVAKTTVYVASATHEAQAAVWEVIRDSPIGRAPSTLVGVSLLGYRGQLVEIEAIAFPG